MKTKPVALNQSLPIRQNYPGLVGVDEVGRGPIAGPVVTAAVRLDPKLSIDGLVDSKKLSHKKRLEWCEWIKNHALDWALGFVEPAKIDEINIFQATLLGMQRAIEQLDSGFIKHVLVDGRHLPDIDFTSTAVIAGDQRVAAISAASILAKVTRDQLMIEYDAQYPAYQFARHKGYPTQVHQQAIADQGPCPIHRQTFSPVKEYLATYE